MPIFKREQEPPFNQAAAARASAPATGQPAPRTDKPATLTPAPAATSPNASAASPLAPSAPASAASRASDPAPAAAANTRPAAAVIDGRTEITGTLKSSGNVLIEGCFHGEVEAKETVWIERGAQSDGQLRARDVVISGAVDGQIECERRLQIAASAVVSGEIKTPTLVIEEGATVNCRFSMTREGAVR